MNKILVSLVGGKGGSKAQAGKSFGAY